MTYRPAEARAFGPPVNTWLLPGAYFALSFILIAVVAFAHLSQHDSWLVRYVVEGDAQRIIGSRVLAAIFFGGGVAVMLRTAMRGVVIHPDGVEARNVGLLGWPTIKNCTWQEIDEFVFESTGLGVALWNGERVWLPRVWDDITLRKTIVRVARARAIPMRGDAVPDFDDDE